MGERIDRFKSTIKVAEVKAHIQRNQKAYITGGVCLAIGVLGTLAAAKNNSTTVISSIEGNRNNFVGTAEHVTVVVAELERRGHPGNVVRCLETGEVFASQRRAAEMLGVNPGEISKQLRGLTDKAGGYTFENLGEAA